MRADTVDPSCAGYSPAAGRAVSSGQLAGPRFSGREKDTGKVVLPSLVAVILFVIVVFGIIMPAFNSAMIDRKKEMIKEMTHVAMNILGYYHGLEQTGELSAAQARDRAVDQLRNLHYGTNNKDYFWINDMEPHMIMHPFRPDLEGQDLNQITDPNGSYLFRDFVKTVRRDGAGFVSYMWQWKDDPTRIVPKVSYVAGFEPWGWIIGTGIYLEDVRAELAAITGKLVIISGMILLVVSMLSLYVVRQGLRNAARRRRAEAELREIHENLQEQVWLRTAELSSANGQLRREIEERTQIEAALRESEERYRDLFESASDLIQIIDRQGRLLYVNRAWRQTLGYTVAEVATLNLYDIIAPQRRLECFDLMKNLAENNSSFVLETEFIAKNGAVIQVEGSFSSRDGKGEVAAVRSIFREVTDRKRLEEERIRHQKLESLGMLAGGIAHDFNNILMVIMGNLNLASRSLSEDDPIRKHLLATEKATLRARDLTLQLLTFAKGGAPIRRTTSIAALLRDSTEFVSHGANVKCVLELADDLQPVNADAGQLGQVVQNLVLNAFQAMPHGGVATISARNRVISEHDRLPLKNGHYVEILVQDQGPGIPAQDIPRLFDPYFTTKAKGQGLGLAVVHSIVTKHDGLITVQSIPGEGSVFFVFLPVATRVESIDGPGTGDVLMQGQGRILLMDDDPQVRTVAAEMLAVIGYEVEQTEDGVEALDSYQKARNEGRPFAAVIMDLTIPGGMGGKEAVQKLLALDPVARVVVSSGYANDPIMADFTKYGFRAVVPKPYRIEGLSRVLHSVLRE
ncbi:MAG: hypothetical protein A2521_07925 [Deltaproteobacteria bacterium RIFOXYD12_FULL_57_12]|nr:MAG: hypothetical protein A2521_07925 [Deltaproteobacteria bacterium RIFOXYD12_FULL_57_12]